jgi:hypothetical protein
MHRASAAGVRGSIAKPNSFRPGKRTEGRVLAVIPSLSSRNLVWRCIACYKFEDDVDYYRNETGSAAKTAAVRTWTFHGRSAGLRGDGAAGGRNS